MPGPIATTHIAAYNQIAGLAGMITPEELDAAHAVYALTPDGSHILWLMGHVALSAELFVGRQIDLPMQVPKEWVALFDTGSKAMLDAAKYPAYAELRAAAINGHKRIADRIATMHDEALLAPMPDDFSLKAFAPNIDAFLSFGQLHANYHLGQVTMLLKAQGLKAGVGM